MGTTQVGAAALLHRVDEHPDLVDPLRQHGYLMVAEVRAEAYRPWTPTRKVVPLDGRPSTLIRAITSATSHLATLKRQQPP